MLFVAESDSLRTIEQLHLYTWAINPVASWNQLVLASHATCFYKLTLILYIVSFQFKVLSIHMNAGHKHFSHHVLVLASLSNCSVECLHLGPIPYLLPFNIVLHISPIFIRCKEVSPRLVLTLVWLHFFCVIEAFNYITVGHSDTLILQREMRRGRDGARALQREQVK